MFELTSKNMNSSHNLAHLGFGCFTFFITIVFLGSHAFLHDLSTVCFILDYLLKDVCNANTLRRSGQCLAPEQSWFTVHYNKDNIYFWGKVQAGLLPIPRYLGFLTAEFHSCNVSCSMYEYTQPSLQWLMGIWTQRTEQKQWYSGYC